MKIKKISWLFPCLLLGFGTVANAALVAEYDYTGTWVGAGGTLGNGITVTGFAGVSDTDSNSFTQHWKWTIDEDGSSFHNIFGNPGMLPTTASGFGVVKDILNTPSNIVDVPIDIGFLSSLTSQLIAAGASSTTFPTGVSPAINLVGLPVFSTGIVLSPIPGFVIDSTFQVLTFDFDGNTMDMDIIEVMNPGGLTGFGQFLSFASPDGEFNRSFEIQGTVNTTVVPVPAAFWLFGSAIVGLFASKRKAKLGNV